MHSKRSSPFIAAMPITDNSNSIIWLRQSQKYEPEKFHQSNPNLVTSCYFKPWLWVRVFLLSEFKIINETSTIIYWKTILMSFAVCVISLIFDLYCRYKIGFQVYIGVATHVTNRSGGKTITAWNWRWGNHSTKSWFVSFNCNTIYLQETLVTTSQAWHLFHGYLCQPVTDTFYLWQPVAYRVAAHPWCPSLVSSSEMSCLRISLQRSSCTDQVCFRW